MIWGYPYFRKPPYFWDNCSDLTATSLESWLVRGIIPIWSHFRLICPDLWQIYGGIWWTTTEGGCMMMYGSQQAYNQECIYHMWMFENDSGTHGVVHHPSQVLWLQMMFSSFFPSTVYDFQFLRPFSRVATTHSTRQVDGEFISRSTVQSFLAIDTWIMLATRWQVIPPIPVVMLGMFYDLGFTTHISYIDIHSIELEISWNRSARSLVQRIHKFFLPAPALLESGIGWDFAAEVTENPLFLCFNAAIHAVYPSKDIKGMSEMNLKGHFTRRQRFWTQMIVERCFHRLISKGFELVISCF